MKRKFVAFLLSALPAFGQSSISPAAKHAYAANAGWIDFRPSSEDGARVAETLLSGKAYAADIGWIDFGDGSPDNGHGYSNASATDFGVNMAANGSLSGYAYAANAGWIAFEQSQGKPKLDFFTGQISGHAYSANLGWISLDTPSSDLVTLAILRPDTDSDGIADAWEMIHFSNLTAANGISDADRDGATDFQEYEAGTDPSDPGSRFRIISHSFGTGGSLGSIEFTTGPGRLYRLEHDADLQGTWTDSALGIFAPDPGASTSKVIALPGGTSRFVRAISIKPLQP
jgi:hypothetical protein